MSYCGHTTPARKGHLRGGLFLAALALAGCAASVPSGSPLLREPTAEATPAAGSLQTYRSLGFIAGTGRFPAVGRFVILPGPSDSAFVIFGLSFPNSALRFRRDPPGFVARYRVDVALSGADTIVAQLGEIQEVRVRSFRETSRRDESVVFQGYLKAVPGDYSAQVEVRDLATGAGFESESDLRVPRFGPSSPPAPVVVYQAEPRTEPTVAPTFILSPRATVVLGDDSARIYLEGLSGSSSAPLLEVRQEGQVVLEKPLQLRRQAGPLVTALAALDIKQLPAGALSLRARLNGATLTDSATLMVALTSDRLVADYQEVVGYLRHAGTPEQLEALRTAPPRERAQQLHGFWSARDLVPETAENEFFERYFRRIREANDRFAEALTAGWLTDRGEVYVTLGPPDEVFRHLDTGQGPEQSQVWLYKRPNGRDRRLTFIDRSGTGAFRLTGESRRAFHQVVEALYSPKASPS